MASAIRESHTHDRADGSSKVKVTILASEWGSSKGGLSTINRELAIQLAKFPDVEITFFLPQCSDKDKKVALNHNVKIVEATRRPGYEELELLNFPPEHLQIDVIVGHGVKLGHQAQVIRDSKKCSWVQVVHTDPEELGMFKNYTNPISKGEVKHKTEVELCEMADLVVGVGPKLSEAFRSYLRGCQKDQNILDFTPGIFDEFLDAKQVPEERKQCSVLVFGRGDAEDFELKGFDIAGKAVAELPDTRLVFVGAPDGKHEEIAKRLTGCGVPASRLRVRGFVQNRESLKRLFQEVDLLLMPSRTEGFGLTGLEALSAGLPLLVSQNSGFGEALRNVPFGSSFVIDSEDPNDCATAIKKIWKKDRNERLDEAETMRYSYAKKYNWAKQIKDLLDRIISMVHADVLQDAESSAQRKGGMFPSDGQVSQWTVDNTENHAEPSSAGSPEVVEQQPLVESPEAATCKPHSNEQPPHNEEVEVSGMDKEDATALSKRKKSRSNSDSTSDAGPSSEKDNIPKVDSTIEQWLVAETHDADCKTSEQQCLLLDEEKTASATNHPGPFKENHMVLFVPKVDAPGKEHLVANYTHDAVCTTSEQQTPLHKEKKASAANKEDAPSLSKEFLQNSGSTLDPGDLDSIIRLLFTSHEDLRDEEKERFDKILKDLIQGYLKHNKLYAGLGDLLKYLINAHNVVLQSVGKGSLVIEVQCPTLESLESLWNDYRSGHLNEVAETYLVTDEIKRKHNLETARLKTTIEEENYLICKEAFMKQSPKIQRRQSEDDSVDLQRQLREMQQREQNSQRQMSEMQQREENLQRQLREVRQREENLQRQLRDVGQREENSQRQMREMGQREENLQRQMREMGQREENLQRQLTVKDRQVNELQLSLSTAQQTISELRRHETCDWVIARDEIQMTDRCLGRGGWGSVYEGKYCGCAFAVKQIHDLILSPHNIRLFEREMNIASKCRHPSLLQFIGATNDEGSPLFVTELMETSLRALLERRQLSETEIFIISQDVARALNYLHQKKPEPIIHRDISSANVLLWRQGDEWRGKVSDYGTANFMQNTMTVAPGAMIYSAPEALTSNQTVKVDVYSFGVLLCEMSIRELPDPRRRDEQVVLVTNHVLRDLVRRCLQTDPNVRPNMQQIIDELDEFNTTS